MFLVFLINKKKKGFIIMERFITFTNFREDLVERVFLPISSVSLTVSALNSMPKEGKPESCKIYITAFKNGFSTYIINIDVPYNIVETLLLDKYLMFKDDQSASNLIDLDILISNAREAYKEMKNPTPREPALIPTPRPRKQAPKRAKDTDSFEDFLKSLEEDDVSPFRDLANQFQQLEKVLNSGVFCGENEDLTVKYTDKEIDNLYKENPNGTSLD